MMIVASVLLGVFVSSAWAEDAVNGQVVDVAKDLVVDAAKDPVVDAAKDLVVGAAKGQVVDAAKGPVVDVAKGPVVDAAKGPVVDAAKGPVVDVANGQVLHDARCLEGCHVNTVYTRDGRDVTSFKKLKSQVAVCNNAVKKGEQWFDDDEADVVAYLNKHFYKFDVK